MKTITPLLLATASLVWGVAANSSHAQVWQTAVHRAVIATASHGQASADDDDLTPKQKAAELLSRAKAATLQSKFEAAESLIAQAEKLGVKYGPLYFGDTPEKARRRLEHAVENDEAESALPSKKAAGPLSLSLPQFGNKSTVEDPFGTAGVDGDASDFTASQQRQNSGASSKAPTNTLSGGDELKLGNMPAAGPPTDDDLEALPTLGTRPLPKFGMSESDPVGSAPLGDAGNTSSFASRPQPNPFVTRNNGPANAIDTSGGSEVSAGSEQLLLESRRALAADEIARAGMLAEQCKQLHRTYEKGEDTPEKVEAAVRAVTQWTEQRRTHGDTEASQRRRATLLMQQAEALIAWNDLDTAESLTKDAASLGVAFAPFETRPDTLLQRITELRKTSAGNVAAVGPAVQMQQPASVSATPFDAPPAVATTAKTASSMTAATGADVPSSNTTAQYNPADDNTQNVAAQTQGTASPTFGRPGAGNRADLFAGQPSDDTPFGSELETPSAAALETLPTGPSNGPSELLEMTAAQQQALVRQVTTELGTAQQQARQVMESDPKRALDILDRAREALAQSRLDESNQRLLERRLDSFVAEIDQYIQQNRSRIELDGQNRQVLADVDRRRNEKIERETKLAELIDEANQLMEERRFPEAEVLVKRAQELAPDHPVVAQLMKFTRLWRQTANNRDIMDAREDGLLGALESIEDSAIPWDDRESMTFPDGGDWNALTKSRRLMEKERGRKRSPREIEIEQKLSDPVQLDFQQAPLSEVMAYLGELAGINIVLSLEGLAEEGVTTESPITIQLRTEVSLKSALHLILSQYHLGYVIQDEVLKITSEQMHDSNVYPDTYYVADLVMPIPHFVPSRDMGLAGAVRDAIGHAASLGFEGSLGFASQSPMTTLAKTSGGGSIDPATLAQVNTAGSLPPIGGGLNQSAGAGPGGLGGGVLADFDTLINLIQATIEPTTWDIVGGEGSIQPYPNNLSLVISTTQEIHEQIVELLEQLRRLQDLQVTIEVRFITLNDNFFERIGVDFDFDIDSDIDRPFQVFGQQDPDFTPTYSTTGTPVDPGRDLQDRNHGDSVTVGRSGPDTFSLDLDIPFRQGSFGLAVPQFGGFDPSAGAQLGFAILSDLEAYFFVSAAQGDRRSNVLQAPKVTLFNGQQAFVSDQSQSPFVISVIPVVGDFAAAQQPVIVVLSEGTHLTVQAVVSNDRRFVRLTVVPFFSQIGDVSTFQFTGSSTTTDDSSTSTGPTAGEMSDNEMRTTTNEGTTVQLPTFSFVSVTTTVSVPDGGTVLLGGVKRLSEGRNEFGVPLLSKIPYINRLFSNVGIGRETQSLMMMVTPRIIIQEEEEELRGLATPN